MKTRLIAVAVFALFSVASAGHATMQDDVDRGLSIIERFGEIPESAIPPAVMRDAKGVAIFTMTKVGFIVSGRGGSGIVLARTETGWSGPSAIGTGGIGVGFQAGMQVTEHVMILNTRRSAQGFHPRHQFHPRRQSKRRGGSGRVVPPKRVSRRARRFTPTAAARGFSPECPWRARRSRPAMKRMRSITASRCIPPTYSRARCRPPAGAQKLLEALAKY